MIDAYNALMSDRVLIETLWNVKMNLQLFAEGDGAGINRNIVECKDGQIKIGNVTLASINRNIVECKVRQMIKTC